MPTLLLMPRDVTVSFAGLGILAHNVLRRFSGQTMHLHEGFNRVADDVAQHPSLRSFIVDDSALPKEPPPMPTPAPFEVYEPALEPPAPAHAMLATANEPDADAKAVERAKADSVEREKERVARAAQKPPLATQTTAQPAADLAAAQKPVVPAVAPDAKKP